MKKVMSVLLSAVLMIMTYAMPVFAFELSDYDENDIKAPGTAGTTVAKLIGTMQWFGYAIAIGMLVYIGIKYVMAPANEKADLKNNLVKYVVGSVLIAGAVTIATWVFDISV